MSKELSIFGIVVGIVLMGILSFLIDIETLRTFVAQSGIWAPLAFIGIKMSTLVFAPLSGGALYPIAGGIFGFPLALTYTMLADFLGLTIAFWISRKIGRERVIQFTKQKPGGVLDQILTSIDTPKRFFLASLLFIPMPELLAYAAGLTKLPYATFIVILFPLWTLASMTLIFLGSLF